MEFSAIATFIRLFLPMLITLLEAQMIYQWSDQVQRQFTGPYSLELDLSLCEDKVTQSCPTLCDPKEFSSWNTGVGRFSLLQGHCEKQRDKNRAEVGGISWNAFPSIGVWKGGLSRSATARGSANRPFSFPFSLPFSFPLSLTLCNIPLQGLKLESFPISSKIHTFHWG